MVGASTKPVMAKSFSAAPNGFAVLVRLAIRMAGSLPFKRVKKISSSSAEVQAA
jgi:hypothetical protein